MVSGWQNQMMAAMSTSCTACRSTNFSPICTTGLDRATGLTKMIVPSNPLLRRTFWFKKVLTTFSRKVNKNPGSYFWRPSFSKCVMTLKGHMRRGIRADWSLPHIHRRWQPAWKSG